MANAMELQEKDFRTVVVSVSDKLTEAETNALVYTYSLPSEYMDKKPLIVLQLMHNRDVFSVAKPDGLASLMKELNRMDLVKMVKDHIRKNASKQRRGSKSRAQLQSTASTESGTVPFSARSDPSLFASLQAKLEVTDIQSRITTSALDQSLEMVKRTQLKRVEEIMQEAKIHADQLHRLIVRAQRLYQLSECGTNSSEEDNKTTGQPSGALKSRPSMQRKSSLPIQLSTACKQPSDDDDIYSSPCFEDAENKGVVKGDGVAGESDSDEYVQMTIQTSTPQPGDADTTEHRAQMVTGLSGKGTKPDKPATRPKPNKPRTEVYGDVIKGSSPRDSPLPIPQQPAIAPADILKRRSTLKRASIDHAFKSESAVSGRGTSSSREAETADYSGGSQSAGYTTGGEGTGDYSGDSGFGDVASLMKVKIGNHPVPKPRPRRSEGFHPAAKGQYYKTLGTPDPVDSYMSVQRDHIASHSVEDGLYVSPNDLRSDIDEVTYMNVHRQGGRVIPK